MKNFDEPEALAALGLDMSMYGFGGSSFEVALFGRDGHTTKVVTVASNTVKLSRVVARRSLEMLEIKPVTVSQRH